MGSQAYPFGEIVPVFQEIFADCVQQLIRIIPLHLIGQCVPREPSTTGGNSPSTYGGGYNEQSLPNYSTQHNNGDGSSSGSSSGSSGSSSSGYHFFDSRNNNTAVSSFTHDDRSIEKFPLFGMDLPSFHTEKLSGKYKSDIILTIIIIIAGEFKKQGKERK